MNKKGFIWYGTKQRFSLRKYSFGLCSALLGTLVVPVATNVVFPTASVVYAAETTVSTSADFVRDWNKPEDKTINLDINYSGAVRPVDITPNTALVNTTTTTVNGNNEDLRLRDVSIDNKKILTINNSTIEIVADATLTPPSVTSSGTLTLNNVKTSGIIKPDLNVTGGTAAVTNGTSETVFNTITVSNDATLTLEGNQIDAKVVKATDNAEVITNSTGVDEYQGGNLTLKDINGEVKITSVKTLTLEGKSSAVLMTGSTVTDKLHVPADTTLNIGDNQITVTELSGTGKIIMKPAGTLTVGTLLSPINVEIKTDTLNWAPYDSKNYVVVTNATAQPVVTSATTPVGKKIEGKGNVWKLANDTELYTAGLEEAIAQATDPSLADALKAAKDVLANSQDQKEIDAAEEKLFAAIEALMNNPKPAPVVEKGSVTVKHIDIDSGRLIPNTTVANVVVDQPVGTAYDTVAVAHNWFDENGNVLTDQEVLAFMGTAKRTNPIYVRVKPEKDIENYVGQVSKGTTEVVYEYRRLQIESQTSVKQLAVEVSYVNEQGQPIAPVEVVPASEKTQFESDTIRLAIYKNGAGQLTYDGFYNVPESIDIIKKEFPITDITKKEVTYDVSDKKKTAITAADGKVYEYSKEKVSTLVGQLTYDQANATQVNGTDKYVHRVVLEYKLPAVENKIEAISQTGSIVYTLQTTDGVTLEKGDVVRDAPVEKTTTTITTAGTQEINRKEEKTLVNTPYNAAPFAPDEFKAVDNKLYRKVAVVSGDEAGNVRAGIQEVVYAYELIKTETPDGPLVNSKVGTVQVQFVDEKGNKIADQVVLKDNVTVETTQKFVTKSGDVVISSRNEITPVQDIYNAKLVATPTKTAADGKVYEFVSLQSGIETGDVQAGTHTVVYEYRLKTEEVAEGDVKVTKTGSVEVQYVNESGDTIKASQVDTADAAIETTTTFVTKSGTVEISRRDVKTPVVVSYSTEDHKDKEITATDGTNYVFSKLKSGLEIGQVVEGKTVVVYEYKVKPHSEKALKPLTVESPTIVINPEEKNGNLKDSKVGKVTVEYVLEDGTIITSVVAPDTAVEKTQSYITKTKDGIVLNERDEIIPVEVNYDTTGLKFQYIDVNDKQYYFVKLADHSATETGRVVEGETKVIYVYRLVENQVPKVDNIELEKPEGNISVFNLLGELPPTENEKPILNILAENKVSDETLVHEKPEGNISVFNLLGELPPTEDEKPILNIPVETKVLDETLVYDKPTLDILHSNTSVNDTSVHDKELKVVSKQIDKPVNETTQKYKILPKTGSENNTTLLTGLGMMVLSFGLTGKRSKKNNK